MMASKPRSGEMFIAANLVEDKRSENSDGRRCSRSENKIMGDWEGIKSFV